MNTNNWIDVESQTPDYGQPVIAYSEDRSQRIARYWNTGKWTIDGFGVDGEWKGVTHWQPLPEPPPKPDAFEEWSCNFSRMGSQICLKGDKGSFWVSKDYLRIVWDAATKAAKEGK